MKDRRRVKAPHKLDLYRLAVQHPPAEAAFLQRVYAHYRRGAAATRLREDFAGTAAVAAAWVAMDENHRALAVERHAPTLRRATKHAYQALGERSGDLHFLLADVTRVHAPRVDITAALNFSIFIYHQRDALVDYFSYARRSLDKKGLLVIDAYGGPGAMRMGIQTRRIVPAQHEKVLPFEYQWEQRSHDAATGKIDCRIHFVLRGGQKIRNAFVYDWRLWSLVEIVEAMRDAGFVRAEIWCDRYDPRKRRSDGVYRPAKRMDAREDWVAYVVGVK